MKKQMILKNGFTKINPEVKVKSYSERSVQYWKVYKQEHYFPISHTIITEREREMHIKRTCNSIL